MSTPDVRISLDDRVALLTIDRRPANALSRATLAELGAAVTTLTADDQVKVLVITGAGEFAFVAGADLKEIRALVAAGELEAGRQFVLAGQSLFRQIEACPKPVIAAVNGVALGGGLELALACHVRIVAEHARLGLTETNLGLIPGWGGTQRLPRLVGVGRAVELILTGDMISAQESFRIGLANRVVPGAELLDAARGLAVKLADKSRLTNEATLRAVFGGLPLAIEEGLQLEAAQFCGLMYSNDTQEGLAAFFQKRPPKFTDS